MTYEITDTNSQFNDNIPDGSYRFDVVSVVRKEIKEKRAYEWTLNYDGGQGRVLTWPNQIGPLLVVLGAKEDPVKKGHYLWETDAMVGKSFKATISHYPDKKDPKKFYQTIEDFKACEDKEDIPF